MNRATRPAVAPLVLGPVDVAVAAAAVLWWLVGDLSSTVAPGVEPDYTVGPVRVPGWVELGAGVLGLVLPAGTAVAAARAGRPRARYVALVLMAVVGGLLGWIGRVATAGVVGADIGVGLAVLLLGPVLLVLCAVAGRQTVRAVRA